MTQEAYLLDDPSPRKRVAVIHVLSAAQEKVEPASACCEQPDGRQRVAGHHLNVGVRAGRDAAEFAVLHQNLGSDGCRLSQNLDWRKYLAADRELAALLNIGLAEEIGAEADLHARGPTLVQASDRGLVSHCDFLLACAGRPAPRALIDTHKDHGPY